MIKNTKYEVDEWVMVDYDKTLYSGEILSVDEDNFMVNAMVAITTNIYVWPSTKDIQTISTYFLK